MDAGKRRRDDEAQHNRAPKPDEGIGTLHGQIHLTLKFLAFSDMADHN
jgi:hypothetical protein